MTTVCAKDSTPSEDLDWIHHTDGMKEIATKEPEKSAPAPSPAHSAEVEEREHQDVSRLRLTVILASLWVGYSKLWCGTKSLTVI